FALRGARLSGVARVTGRLKPWRRATRLRCVLGASRRSKEMVSHTVKSESGKWVGESNLPVLVRRSALGENSPNADLCLTAWHSVYVDGFLIPVGDLVNGTSIVFETADGRDTLDFFQIELDSHGMLDAQGAFCESLYQAGTERCRHF